MEMRIFTFTSKQGNQTDGEYDFVADQWTNALGMAMVFEQIHNKGAFNKNYKIKFNTNRDSIRSIIIRPGFINIRDRSYNRRMAELLR